MEDNIDLVSSDNADNLSEKSVWYFAKQETNFDTIFSVVKELDDNNAWGEHIQSVWDSLSNKPNSKLTNIRSLSTAQLFGLVSRNVFYKKNTDYSKVKPTDVFYKLKKFDVSSPEFMALKTEQLLKVRFRALTDQGNNVYTDESGTQLNYSVYPFIFTLLVLWKLYKRNIFEISKDTFLLLIATSKRMEDVDNVVEQIVQKNSFSEEEKKLITTYKANSRAFKLIVTNFHLVEKENGSEISLVPAFNKYYSYFFEGPYQALINMMNLIVADDSIYYKLLTSPMGLDINFVQNRPPKVGPSLDFGEEKKENRLEKEFTSSNLELPLQQIIYGAPGTGKSHALKDCTKGCEVIRTTFHPDSDYSTFVGSYKPTSEEDSAGNEKIVYRFVVQSFLQAYISAWKKYKQANNSTQLEKVFLVIEEINRGNCAQIFGDLFQLLDRNDSGFSDYQIKADSDMKKQLSRAFSVLRIPLTEHINSQYDDTTDKIFSGDILLLPPNLYIWATMNTSDQSLFPIDSAFKRRWNWTYMPISNANKDWVIKIDNSSYDWWSFIEKINDKIGATTNSEDKKLGYFFCKAKDKVISQKTFVGKVIFYLWNDVFKDYDFDDDIFNDVDGSKLTFEKFYTSEGMNSQIVSEKVIRFLENLHVQKLSTEENSSDDNNDESNKENDIEEHQE